MSQIQDLSEFLDTASNEINPTKVNLPAALLDSGESSRTMDALTGDIISPTKGPQTTVPLPLQGIDLSKVLTRAELMAGLTSNLPRNEYNLPRLIYRADLLDPSLFHVPPSEEVDIAAGISDKYEIMAGVLESAAIPLNYFEGYPAFTSGEPIWARMPFESVEDYALFESYRRLPGARQINLLDPQAKSRAVDLFHCCYWNVRCQAADAFATIHYQRTREQRIINADNAHYLHAQALIDRLKSLENEIDWAALATDPEKYVQTLERVIKIQRQALGQITPNGSAAKDGQGGSGTLSVELGMRRITQQFAPNADKNVEDNQNPLKLLDDPQAAEMAQELILKIQQK